jgi:hypothetical protein
VKGSTTNPVWPGSFQGSGFKTSKDKDQKQGI